MKINFKSVTIPFDDLLYGEIFYDPDGDEYCMKIHSFLVDGEDEANAVYLKSGEVCCMPLDAKIIPVNAEITIDR